MLTFFKVDQLDMSKAKATELLRAYDADAVKALTAWVTNPAWSTREA